jgi:hypothetical protein
VLFVIGLVLFVVILRRQPDGRPGGQGNSHVKDEPTPGKGGLAAIARRVRSTRRAVPAKGACPPSSPRRLSRTNLFAATPLERWKKIKETIARASSGDDAVAGNAGGRHPGDLLVIKAWPALSLSFILENPKDYMTGRRHLGAAGGHVLPGAALAAGGRAGGHAGRRLSQRIRPRQLVTRIVNLAVMNLAGVPSIVHALFGVGAFVLFAGMGRSLWPPPARWP